MHKCHVCHSVSCVASASKPLLSHLPPPLLFNHLHLFFLLLLLRTALFFWTTSTDILPVVVFVAIVIYLMNCMEIVCGRFRSLVQINQRAIYFPGQREYLLFACCLFTFSKSNIFLCYYMNLSSCCAIAVDAQQN